ncbi:MAG: hypothetical protein A3F90_18965 [Deltaproteobacteria bacterium RIFCSPLOWO2_12_FULL_60_19]|nr:MAG: hypothetical protein A3F90_18965 [Deltaproteobacteria bacterium RIFCSPLOWO2_12_FULL_60_19]
MSESDETIDWSKTTFEGSRREQLRRWHALSLRQRLEALDRLSDLAGPDAVREKGARYGGKGKDKVKRARRYSG